MMGINAPFPADDARSLAKRLAAPTSGVSRRLAQISGAALLLVLLWSIFVPIASGAIAPGHMIVEDKRKTLQHLDGGIVSDILVREGQVVRRGAVLIRFDDGDARLNVEVLQSQLDSLRAEQAARQAELAGAASVIFPADLLARAGDLDVAAILRAQRAAFNARRANMTGEQSQLGERVTQIAEDAEGSRAQARARAEQIALLESEIRDTEALVEKGFATRPRLLALQRAAADLRGEKHALDAAVAKSRAQTGETLIQRRQLERNAGATAADALRAIQSELVQVVEKLGAARQVLARKEVRAPVAGTVVSLNVTTIGGVVKPGEPMLDIVPSQRRLMVAAQIAPMHGDDVRSGQQAFVRFDAIGVKNAPTFAGKVRTISADALTDPRSGQTYFEALIDLPAEELARLPRELLKPGLPAEVLVKTGERSTIAYLMAPITRATFHAMRE